MIDVDAAHRVREAFLAAEYTVTGATAALGPQAWAAIARDEPVAARMALPPAPESALSTLLRLFILGDEVEPHADVPVEAMASLGLVERGVDGVRALVDVRPYGEDDIDWWVVSDLAHLAGRALAPDHVLGVGGASATLARITPRTAVRTAADIGTGCGVQALHLTRHAEQVIATDTNTRALWAARLTAALSGVAFETRAGSFLDPLAGHRHDLVVSNPPFVISPAAAFEYRDAGLRADDVGRTLVRDLPAHLTEGGTAVLLANWLHVRGQDWRDRVLGWVDGLGVRAWVVQRDVQDPAQYVGTWLRDAQPEGGRPDPQRAQEWLEALADLETEAVGFGWIVLQRTDEQDPSVVVEDRVCAPRLPSGAEVLAALAAHQVLADTDALALLARPLTVPSGVVLRPESHRTSDGWLPGLSRIDLAGGWRGPVEIDDVGAALVRACDGSTPLGEVLDRLAADTGIDPDEVLAGGLLTARALLGEGLLALA